MRNHEKLSSLGAVDGYLIMMVSSSAPLSSSSQNEDLRVDPKGISDEFDTFGVTPDIIMIFDGPDQLQGNKEENEDLISRDYIERDKETLSCFDTWRDRVLS
ncbi:uncharacterized protein LOC141587410 [Silene latifolia]|uniref:uncharacterized protein LOC141587410 n=1 Tax=Silene latifolia TaxID=37657 RepID=UPI003D7726F4